MTLLKDMSRFGPAPTWERELAATAGNLVIMLVAATLFVFVLGSVIAAGIVVAVGLISIAGRLVVARRRTRAGESR